MKKLFNHKFTWLGLLGLFVCIVIASNYYPYRLDLTAEKRFSVSTATKKILTELDSTVTITVFLTGDLPADYRKLNQATQDLLNDFKSITSGNALKISFQKPGESITNDSNKVLLYDSLARLGVVFEQAASVSNINHVLSGYGTGGTFFYKPSSEDDAGSATLTLSVNDGGNTGSGGALSAATSTTIHITHAKESDGSDGHITEGVYSSAGEMRSESYAGLGEGAKVTGITYSGEHLGKLSYTDDGKCVYSVTKTAIDAYVKVHGEFESITDKMHVTYTQGGQTYQMDVSYDIEGQNSAEYHDKHDVNSANVKQTSGHVEDGYISGATVFADANADGILNNGEAFAITDATGGFTLIGGSGNIVMTGGTDMTTHLANTIVMGAVEGSTVVTPLTTLI